MTLRSCSVVALIAAFLAAVFLAGCAEPHSDLPDGPLAQARTPVMGWNTWNSFGCAINETLVKQEADALVASGLVARGYRYVVVDDCWMAPTRAPDGELQANPTTFPSGMAELGRYLHSLGLKFGIYSSPSHRTCAQSAGIYPGSTGSAGHEAQDARTFAKWGVDMLKYDWCSTVNSPSAQRDSFITMRNALAATRRQIVYSINPNSGLTTTPGATAAWGGIANSVRVTQDVTPAWRANQGPAGYQGIAEIVDALGRMHFQGGGNPPVFADPDMLEVGVQVSGQGLTDDESRSEFAMWCMVSAPLIAGNDVRAESRMDILGNQMLIGIDQDVSPSAIRVGNNWVRRLSDGRTAVAFYNDGGTQEVFRYTEGVPSNTVDVWSGLTLPAMTELVRTVAPHATEVFVVTPS